MEQYQAVCKITNRPYYANAMCVAEKIGLVDPWRMKRFMVGGQSQVDVQIKNDILVREIKKLVRSPQLRDYVLENLVRHCTYWVQCIRKTCSCSRREMFELECLPHHN